MDINEIKQLIQKYHNCETSVEEETQLREYFTGNDIPAELQGQKQYFQFLAEEQKTALSNPDFDRKLFDRIKPAPSFFQLYRTPIGVAAGILLLISLFLMIPKDYLKKDSYFTRVEDTYDDPYLAYQEAKRALAFVAEKMETGTSQLETLKTVDKGIQELNTIKKVDKAVNQYGKMASVNKLGRYFMSFN